MIGTQIKKPRWRAIVEVPNLDDAGVWSGMPDPTRGVVFHAEAGKFYAYMAEIDGKIKYVVPIFNEEYAYDTAEEAGACPQLIQFAVSEGGFPSFRESLEHIIEEFVDENLAVELMRDRDAGDIAPEQDAIVRNAIKEIAAVLAAVWTQNRPARKDQVQQ